MRRTKRIALAVATVSLVTAAWVQTQARPPRRGVAVRAKGDVPEPKLTGAPVGRMHLGIIARDFGDPPPDPFEVIVDPDLNLDPNTQALYQQMAATLDGYAAVPQDRLNFYSALNNIAAWGGVVEDVQPNGGGYLVTVNVNAVLSPGDNGLVSFVAMPGPYSEIYQVTNGVIQYMGFNDPQNAAGQQPVYEVGL